MFSPVSNLAIKHNAYQGKKGRIPNRDFLARQARRMQRAKRCQTSMHLPQAPPEGHNISAIRHLDEVCLLVVRHNFCSYVVLVLWIRTKQSETIGCQMEQSYLLAVSEPQQPSSSPIISANVSEAAPTTHMASPYFAPEQPHKHYT